MRHSVVEQHRQIDALFAGARRALLREDPEAARRAVAELAGALAAHFEQEDVLYYPAIAGLRPEHAPVVRGFTAEHGSFLERIDGIAQRIGSGGGDDAERAFAALEHAFAAHEAAEEKLLHSLENELRPAS